MLLIVSTSTTNHIILFIKVLLFFLCINIQRRSFVVVVDCYVTNVGVVLSTSPTTTNHNQHHHMSLLTSSSSSLSLHSNRITQFGLHVNKLISSSRNRNNCRIKTNSFYLSSMITSLMSSVSSNNNNNNNNKNNDVKPKRRYTTKNGKIVSSEGATTTTKTGNVQSTRTSSGPINNSNNNISKSNSNKHTIAIIGGGIAGLRCAQRLVQQEKETSQNNIDVTVFDTGRLRPGGRCSSRLPNDPINESSIKSTSSSTSILSKYRYDHAAQVINVQRGNNNKNKNNMDQYETNNEYDDFIKQIKEWEIQDVVRPFPKDTIYTIDTKPSTTTAKIELYDSSNNYNDDDDTTSSSVLYYSPNGMSSIGLNIVQTSSFQLQQDVWVSPSNGIRLIKNQSNNNNKWQVQSIVNGKKYIWGYYDTLIIAHNGKCADRLVSTIPEISNSIHPLMRVNFASSISSTANKMTLNSIYSLSFAVSRKAQSKLLLDTLPSTFCFGYVNNNPIIKSITCQTQKLSNDKNDYDADADVQVWTILSTSDFATAFKGPQENLPTDIVNEVTNIMLLAFEDLLLLLSSSSSSSNVDAKKHIHTSERTRTTATSSIGGKNGGGTSSHDKSNSSSIKKDKYSTSRETTLQILYSKLQLWGAAVPLNVWTIPTTRDATSTTTTTTTTNSQDETNKNKNDNNNLSFKPAGYLYDSINRIGVCGDWLYEPSIAGAWISGNLLAQHILYNITINHSGGFVNDDSTTGTRSSNSKTETGTTTTYAADKGQVKGKFQTSHRVAQVGIGAT